jgi:hypothetical protein
VDVAPDVVFVKFPATNPLIAKDTVQEALGASDAWVTVSNPAAGLYDAKSHVFIPTKLTNWNVARGSVSVKLRFVSVIPEFGFARTNVIVVVPPTAMALGLKDFVKVGGNSAPPATAICVKAAAVKTIRLSMLILCVLRSK